jgi:hypothetical protein
MSEGWPDRPPCGGQLSGYHGSCQPAQSAGLTTIR